MYTCLGVYMHVYVSRTYVSVLLMMDYMIMNYSRDGL